MTKGRFASFPDEQRKNRVSEDGLSLTVWDEGGTKHMTLKFVDEAGSEEIRKQWVACVASATGPAGSWRSIESARGGSSRSRVFIKWASDRGINSLDSLTANDWHDFVAWIRDTYSNTTSKTRNSRLVSVRTLLVQHVGLSNEVKKALSQRYCESQETLLPDHYTAAELQQIRSNATRALRVACRRIEPNWALAGGPASH